MPEHDEIVELAAAISVYNGVIAGALIMAVCAAVALIMRL
jgi:hypothetical protein